MAQAGVREKQITKTSFIGIITNVFLSGFKALVGIIAGSVSVILDAVNNLTDAISSIVTILGLKLSKKRPDKKHPFGYGRIEYFSTIIISAIILVAGSTSMIESVKKIITPELPNYTWVTLVVVGVSVIVKILLGTYFKRQGKKYNSDALVASGSDASFDAILSASTLVGGLITMFSGFSVDGIVGALISIFIIKSGIEMLLESVGNVIGSRVDSEISSSIRSSVEEIDGVLGAYDLILHNYGPDSAIGSVHVEIPASLTAEKIHEITKNIQYSILEKYHVFLTVGIYAVDEKYNKQTEKIKELAKSHEGVMQTHGIFVNAEQKTFSMDIVCDFTVKDKAKICEDVKKDVLTVFPDYSVNINFDTDYSN